MLSSADGQDCRRQRGFMNSGGRPVVALFLFGHQPSFLKSPRTWFTREKRRGSEFRGFADRISGTPDPWQSKMRYATFRRNHARFGNTFKPLILQDFRKMRVFLILTGIAISLGALLFWAYVLAMAAAWHSSNRGILLSDWLDGEALIYFWLPFACGAVLTFLGWRKKSAPNQRTD